MKLEQLRYKLAWCIIHTLKIKCYNVCSMYRKLTMFYHDNKAHFQSCLTLAQTVCYKRHCNDKKKTKIAIL